MAFSFKVQGNIHSLAIEVAEIKLKAREESITAEDLKIEEHLLDDAPYIIVTCKDTKGGERLYQRVERESPRFEKL